MRSSRTKVKPRRYIPPRGDIRNTKRGAEALAQMIKESQAKDAKRAKEG